MALISDTHLPRGARALPDACIERLRSADVIVHAGDFTALSVLRDIASLGPPVAAVCGNVDAPELRRLLPERRMVERVGIVHDAGPATRRLERMRALFPDADAVVFGHSHIPFHATDEDGFQIFNPGSPTDRRRQPRHTMGMARVESGGIEFELVALD